MFLSKNKSSEITTNHARIGHNNYRFSCGSKKNNVNNSSLLYTKSGNQTTDNSIDNFYKILDNAEKSELNLDIFKSVTNVLSENLNLGTTSKRGNQPNDVFNSLNNQLNNNIKTINNNSNRMLPKKRGCGCGGKK